MVRERRDHPELHVRQWTHCERDALRDQAIDENRIFRTAHTVVDAFDLQDVERLPDVRGWPFLARVGYRTQPLGPCPLVHARELLGRMTYFGRVEPDAGDELAVRERRLERGHGFVLRQMAQEAQ